MTYQIIYSSVSSTPMEAEDLEDILHHAQRTNPEKGISGALVYADRFFLQVLEGERSSVERLMSRISRDVRHELVTILQAGEISFPAFSQWEMAYVGATPDEVAQWAGLGATARLPEVFDEMRQDAQRAFQVTTSILSILRNGPAPTPVPA